MKGSGYLNVNVKNPGFRTGKGDTVVADEKNFEDTERVGQTRWMIEHAAKSSLDELLKEVKSQKSVTDILLPALGKKDISVEVMSQLAGFGRATGYKIMNNKMRPEADILIRMAFVLDLSVEEMQQLLKSGRRSMLSGSSARDVAIIFGRHNGLSLGEMDELLEEYGLPALVPPLK